MAHVDKEDMCGTIVARRICGEKVVCDLNSARAQFVQGPSFAEFAFHVANPYACDEVKVVADDAATGRGFRLYKVCLPWIWRFMLQILMSVTR